MKNGGRAKVTLTGVLLVALVALSLLTAAVFAVTKLTGSPQAGTELPFDTLPASPDETTVSYERPEEAAAYNFLVCGTDVATGLSDTVMLVHIETAGGIYAVQLPRDTFIEADGKAMKLNACVANYGTGGTAEILEKALCIKIDYTVSIDTSAFSELVDAVGGIECDVPFDMDYDDPYQNLHIHLKAGRQLLDGEKAMHFVRYRSGYADGDLGRLDAQKSFLREALGQIRSKLDFSSVTEIIRTVLPKIKTDLSLEDCIYFARLVLEGKPGTSDLVMMTCPGKALNWEGSSYYVLGRSSTLETVNTYLNVYSGSITDAIFDSKRIFVLDGNDDFERIYSYSIISVDTDRGQ